MDFEFFESGRVSLSYEALKPYDGKWVAFSPDGTRIVESADDLVTLRDLVEAAGENPENVAYERIVLDDTWQGASVELS